MDCTRIQELLSEYIDGTLDPNAERAVKTHISTCNDCKKMLASLRTVIDELGALDPVKPPADFLEKIHERMEPRFGFDWIAKKLFVPFRIKIPLELAAAATITALVVFVLNIQQTEFRQKQMPKTSTPLRVAGKLKEDRIKSEFKKQARYSAPVLEETAEKTREKELGIKPPSPVLATAKKNASDIKGKPVELVLALRKDISRGFYAPDLAMESMQQSESDKKTVKNENAAGTSLGKSLVAGKKPPSFDPIAEIKDRIQKYNGKILIEKNHDQTGRPRSITVEIPAENYSIFLKELDRLAVFQSPQPSLPHKNQKTVKLLIHFIYPH